MHRFSNRYDREYDDEDYSCQGPVDQCEGCESCTETVQRTTYHVARKARGFIQPGDLVAVSNGFEYQKNGGPRRGYFRREHLAGHGPAHGPAKMGRGWGSRRGGFAKHHPEYAGIAAERIALEIEGISEIRNGKGNLADWEARVSAWETKNDTEWVGQQVVHGTHMSREWVRSKHTEALAATEQAAKKEREHKAIVNAETGETVTHQGGTWTVGPTRAKLIVHSNFGYAGGVGDATAVGVRTLTNTVSGQTVDYRTSRSH